MHPMPATFCSLTYSHAEQTHLRGPGRPTIPRIGSDGVNAASTALPHGTAPMCSGEVELKLLGRRELPYRPAEPSVEGTGRLARAS